MMYLPYLMLMEKVTTDIKKSHGEVGDEVHIFFHTHGQSKSEKVGEELSETISLIWNIYWKIVTSSSCSAEYQKANQKVYCYPG